MQEVDEHLQAKMHKETVVPAAAMQVKAMRAPGGFRCDRAEPAGLRRSRGPEPRLHALRVGEHRQRDPDHLGSDITAAERYEITRCVHGLLVAASAVAINLFTYQFVAGHAPQDAHLRAAGFRLQAVKHPRCGPPWAAGRAGGCVGLLD